jgi:SAM-dependent methyltransferase
VLELGCGAARWSIALAADGARAVGLDLSAGQLGLAARLAGSAPRAPALLRADAERIPFRDGSFDVVFCDWGAMTFADPYRTVPECSRVLRDGGVLAFSTSSPIRELCHTSRTDRLGRRLARDYFGMHRLDLPAEVDFQLPYGEWIRLFRENALVVESLLETRPPRNARSTYLTQGEAEWARHWPVECIWKVRKVADDVGRPGEVGRTP